VRCEVPRRQTGRSHLAEVVDAADCVTAVGIVPGAPPSPSPPPATLRSNPSFTAHSGSSHRSPAPLTLEDVIEELLGQEIIDETDGAPEVPPPPRGGGGATLVGVRRATPLVVVVAAFPLASFGVIGLPVD